MATAFAKTLRSLHSGKSRTMVATIGIALAILCLWGWWLVAAEVGMVEVTEDAWIEVEAAAHRTASPVDGRVIRTNLEIGRWVEEGEPLVVLSGLQTEQEISKEIERRDGAEKRLSALDAVRTRTLEGARAARESDFQAMAKAQADLRVALAAARFASAQAGRKRQLHGVGLVSEGELEEAVAFEDQTREAVVSEEAGIAELESDHRQKNLEWARTLAEIDSRTAELEAEEAIAGFATTEFGFDLEERTIRAPVAGRLGRVSTCRPGSFVAAGDLVAVVVPEGDFKISARFPVASAVGRILPERKAEMRLHALPWMRFGHLDAEVSGVGQDVADGVVTVECRIIAGFAHRELLQHGMRGVLTIEVDRLTPLQLLLTVAGRYRGRPAASGSLFEDTAQGR